MAKLTPWPRDPAGELIEIKRLPLSVRRLHIEEAEALVAAWIAASAARYVYAEWDTSELRALTCARS